VKRVRRRSKVRRLVITPMEGYLSNEFAPNHDLVEDKNNKKHKALGKAKAIQPLSEKRRRRRKPTRRDPVPDKPIE
jgi:hypothetical protein